MNQENLPLSELSVAAHARVAGVDEAGRGPLAGPVVAAAVVLDPHQPIDGLDDSKKLTPRRRDVLYDLIMSRAASVSIAFAEPEEIDRLNILHATMAAMARALDGLELRPEHALIDGNRCPTGLARPVPMTAVVGGDALHANIGAASIVAKVSRDRCMIALDRDYPEYGFAKHKGYPTAQHLAVLDAHGPTRHHRDSFAPVRAARRRHAAGSCDTRSAELP